MGNENNEILTKEIWETIDAIHLLLLIGVNYCQTLIHMYRILVDLYPTEKQINQFSVGYIINPLLHVNEVFREKVENVLIATFHENTMENIRYVMRKKDTCVIAIIMFYGSK